jgi:hypothetical protein
MRRLPQPVDLAFLSGATVTRVYLDQNAAGFFLDLGPVGGTYDWRVEQPFRLRTSGEVCEPDPDNKPSMLPFVSTLGNSVEEAVADLKGHIRFRLSGRIYIECGSDPAYEAWRLAGPGGFLLVSLPGGGLASWAF